MLTLVAMLLAQSMPVAKPGAPAPLPEITGITLLEPSPTPASADLNAPVPPDEGTPGQPVAGNLMRLIGMDDYPTEALLMGEQGTVAVRLSISPAGTVAGCAIIESSKSRVLDSTTCRLFSERAKFRPARDSKGRKIAATFVQRVA